MSGTLKVVLCGAGFIGSNIAKELARIALGRQGSSQGPQIAVQLVSRNPEKLHSKLIHEEPSYDRVLLPPLRGDITDASSLEPATKDAHAVVSLVGLLYGTPEQFERIQHRGAQNVAKVAYASGVKRFVHISAIGADPQSSIPYARTKALGEQAVRDAFPTATIFRPSLVFGPGDDFFNRFAKLSRILPFLPVFDGGKSRFQPIFVGDLAGAVANACVGDLSFQTEGNVVEAGGPDIFTYREMMQEILRATNRYRPIISLPSAVGIMQGMVLERLPQNLFTITPDQVRQLFSDNVVSTEHGALDLSTLVDSPLKPVRDILPTYV